MRRIRASEGQLHHHHRVAFLNGSTSRSTSPSPATRLHPSPLRSQNRRQRKRRQHPQWHRLGPGRSDCMAGTFGSAGTPIEIDFWPLAGDHLNIGKPTAPLRDQHRGRRWRRPDQHSDHRLMASARLLQRYHRPVVGLLNWGVCRACWTSATTSGLYNFATSSMEIRASNCGRCSWHATVSRIYNTGLGALANVSGLLSTSAPTW